MLNAVANFSFVLVALVLLEGGVTQWLLPLGASRTGIRRQRVERYLLPLLAALACLSVLSSPVRATDWVAFIFVALIPVYVALTGYGVVAMGRALRQRVLRSSTRPTGHP